MVVGEISGALVVLLDGWMGGRSLVDVDMDDGGWWKTDLFFGCG